MVRICFIKAVEQHNGVYSTGQYTFSFEPDVMGWLEGMISKPVKFLNCLHLENLVLPQGSLHSSCLPHPVLYKLEERQSILMLFTVEELSGESQPCILKLCQN